MDHIYAMVVMICLQRMQNLTIMNHNGNHYRVNFAFISKKMRII